MSLEEKNKKLASLVAEQGSLIKVVMILRENGNDKMAETMEKAVDNLTLAIEIITEHTLAEWIEASKNFETAIEPLLAEIKNYVSDINKDLKNFKKVSKIVGAIDKVVQQILKKLT